MAVLIVELPIKRDSEMQPEKVLCSVTHSLSLFFIWLSVKNISLHIALIYVYHNIILWYIFIWIHSLWLFSLSLPLIFFWIHMLISFSYISLISTQIAQFYTHASFLPHGLAAILQLHRWLPRETRKLHRHLFITYLWESFISASFLAWHHL